MPRVSSSQAPGGKSQSAWADILSKLKLDAGGLYDPSTDTWRSIRVNDLATDPLRFLYGSGAWADEELLWWSIDALWGYDPVVDQWTPRGTDPAAVHRGFGRQIAGPLLWTGCELIIWGGTVSPSSTAYLATGVRYVPARTVSDSRCNEPSLPELSGQGPR